MTPSFFLLWCCVGVLVGFLCGFIIGLNTEVRRVKREEEERRP